MHRPSSGFFVLLAFACFARPSALCGEDAAFYLDRGNDWSGNKDYDKAIADYGQAIRLDAKNPSAYSRLAWLQATCPDARYRDGRKALSKAKKAYDFDNGWSSLDTLAAAYAESGDFAEARGRLTLALAFLEKDKHATEKEKQQLRSRLELYKHDKPFREEKKLKAKQPQPRG
jgi:tetratricopeptide (TPR) repeat protein